MSQQLQPHIAAKRVPSTVFSIIYFLTKLVFKKLVNPCANWLFLGMEIMDKILNQLPHYLSLYSIAAELSSRRSASHLCIIV